MQISRILPVIFWWIIFISWAGVLLWLSLTPRPPRLEMGFLSWDKLQHLGAYGLLTFLGGKAYRCFNLDKRRRWLFAAAGAAVFGGAVEIAQEAMALGRAAEWGDLLADVLGAGLVYWGALGRFPLLEKNV